VFWAHGQSQFRCVIQHVNPKAGKAGDDIDGGCDDAATSNPIALACSVVGAIWASDMH